MTTTTAVRYVDTYQAIGSSAIDQVWLAENGDVYIQFAGGSTAGYAKVGRALYDNFIKSYSLGMFYNMNIKGKFTGIEAPSGFVKVNAPAAAMNITASVPVNAIRKSRFEVVFEGDIVFPTSAVSETDAVTEAVALISRFNNLTPKVVKVVHYFD